FSDDLLERLVLLLKKRGSENIMTVRSQDGLDELSTTSKNKVYFLKNGIITPMIVDSEKLGLAKPQIKEIQVTNKHEAVNAFVSVLNSTANNAMIEITALNAAGGLLVANIVNSFEEGIEISLDIIKSGMSYSLFEDFVRYCGDIKKLEGFE
ncbi:MAG: anthranilate phosphoribosyltransferase, partial [Nitrosopumilaceae archaeon]